MNPSSSSSPLAAPPSTAEPLPFDGAPLPGPEGAPPAPPDAPAEVIELDLNPRFRRIHGFRSRFLPDQRDISIFLPTAYLEDPARRFPVFYLHDGQNVFDSRTSYTGQSWQAHRALDGLTAAGRIDPVILVGVANAGIRRMAEYTPTRDRRLGGGEGVTYGRLLIEELKPLLDAQLRTLPDRANTALGGSSLGGLISLALGLRFPAIFGKLAVMSPSVWWDNRSILAAVNVSPVSAPLRAGFGRKPPPALPRPKIWLDIGEAEGLRHLRDTDLLHHRLLAHGWRESHDAVASSLRYVRVNGAAHTENAWAARFPAVLEFLFPPQTA